jgi:hypothetical protein
VARKPQIPKRDAERALKVLEYGRKTEPSYRQPNAFGTYLVLLIALAIAGVIVYYVATNQEQFSELWYRATHPDSVPVQVQPDQ